MTFHRNRYLVDSFQVAQEQVNSCKGPEAESTAEVLAIFIIRFYDLAPYDPERTSEGMLKRWLLGEYRETNASTMVMALIEEGAHQLGG